MHVYMYKCVCVCVLKEIQFQKFILKTNQNIDIDSSMSCCKMMRTM